MEGKGGRRQGEGGKVCRFNDKSETRGGAWLKRGRGVLDKSTHYCGLISSTEGAQKNSRLFVESRERTKSEGGNEISPAVRRVSSAPEADPRSHPKLMNTCSRYIRSRVALALLNQPPLLPILSHKNDRQEQLPLLLRTRPLRSRDQHLLLRLVSIFERILDRSIDSQLHSSPSSESSLSRRIVPSHTRHSHRSEPAWEEENESSELLEEKTTVGTVQDDRIGMLIGVGSTPLAWR